MKSEFTPLDPLYFERLREELAVAIARCSDEQVLDLADNLHAILRRRRASNASARLDNEQRSWMG